MSDVRPYVEYRGQFDPNRPIFIEKGNEFGIVLREMREHFGALSAALTKRDAQLEAISQQIRETFEANFAILKANQILIQSLQKEMLHQFEIASIGWGCRIRDAEARIAHLEKKLKGGRRGK